MISKSLRWRFYRALLPSFCLLALSSRSTTALGQKSSDLLISSTISSTYSIDLPTRHQIKSPSTVIRGNLISPTQTFETVKDRQLDSTPTSTRVSLEAESSHTSSSVNNHTSKSDISGTLSGLTLLSVTPTTSSISAPTSLVPASYSLPQPFDATLAAASIATSCLSFFDTFLADPEFIACAPFSLLLSSSKGFFDAQKSPNSLLPYVLSASCSAPSTCSALMKSLAASIMSASACQNDLANGNALPNQALTGFNNYDIMRAAACQKDATTSQFCFAEASASTNRSSLYFYYLPLGTVLPSGAKPSCDSCTKDLVSIYAGYASNPGLLISKTYISGSTAVSQSCGPGFVPFSPVRATSSSANFDNTRSALFQVAWGVLKLVMMI